MLYVILMLVSVSGREIPQISNNEPRQERFIPNNPVDTVDLNYHQNGFGNTNNHAAYAESNRELVNNYRNGGPFVNQPFERNHREDNVNYNSQNGFVSANNPQLFNVQNNREFIPDRNSRNDRNSNPHANYDQLQLNHAQSNRRFISQDRLTSDRSRDPYDSNTRNDRNRDPNTHQTRPHAFNNQQYNEQNNREFIPNHDRPNDRSQGHSYQNSNDEQFKEQNSRELIPDENIKEQNNRKIIPNNNNRNTNAYQGRSHNGGMSIKLAFDRQGNNRGEHSNLNVQSQTFNINNEYSNRQTNRSTNNRNNKYNESILHARRHQDDMIFEDNKETQTNHRNSKETNNGMVSIINNLNNPDHNPNRNQSGFRQTNTKPKTAMENEVTPNSLQNGGPEKDNGSVGNDWVWGVEDTTTVSPVTAVTLDDRAAFSGDKCSTGMVRFRGICVTED